MFSLCHFLCSLISIRRNTSLSVFTKRPLCGMCQVVVGGVLGPMQVPIVPEAWGYGDGEAPGGEVRCVP